MFEFILGGCGTGKSTELMNRIRNDLQNHEKVMLIVPEQFSFEAEKRLYDFLDVKLFNQMKTYSFYTLSQDILLKCGNAGKSYASEQEKLLFLYQAVQECTQRNALKILYKQHTPEAMLSLQRLVAKMRKEGITAEKMQEISPVFTDSVQLREKTQDIAEILTAYDSILKAHGLSDNLNDLTGAVMLAKSHKFFQNQKIYLDEFGTFSGDQYQMIQVMMEQADKFCIALLDERNVSVSSRIFKNGHQTFLNLKQKAEELRPDSVKADDYLQYHRSGYEDLKACAEQIFRGYGNQNLYQNHVHVFQADDPVSEIEYICATIYHLLEANPDMQCRDIAIAVKDPAVYRPLLERAFARYHLPYDIAAEKSILHKELIRYFLTLLEILSAQNWHTDMILKYLKNPFSGYQSETVAMLEHFCFTWSIDKDDWTKKFYAEGEKELNQRSEEFGGQELEQLRLTFMIEFENLKQQCQNADVRKICRVLYQHMAKKKADYEEYLNSDVLKLNEFATLWEMLGNTMNTVVKTMGSEQLALKGLYQIFLILLKSDSFSVPPETLDSIRVVETLYESMTIRLNAPRILFVPGVSDGIFPGEIQNTGVFTEKELQQLEDYHIHIAHLLPELYSDELLIINKILASPSEQLYLTYPEVTIKRELVQPSVMIGEIFRMFPSDAPILQKQDEISLDYYAWTKSSAYFHFVRNLHKNTAGIEALREMLAHDPVYASRVQKLTDTITEQPVRPSKETMHKLFGSHLTVSPSGIETFYNCPFSYFCRYGLKLYAPEKVTLNRQNTGNFAHYCLEKILGKYRQDFTELTEEQLIEEINRLAEIFKKENFSPSVLKDSRFQLNYEANMQSILQLLQHLQEELKKSAFTPAAFEEKLDIYEQLKPYILRDGEILCKGKIDRVDICRTAEQLLMRVVDYKTGKKFLSPEKLAAGLDMQMLIYLLALEQNQAFGAANPAGVLYLPSGQPSDKNYEERKEENPTKEEILHDFYQMKGLLLEDSVKYMESEASDPKPVMKHNDKDILFSMNETQFAHLKEHVQNKICEMADRLYDGDTEPNPYLYQEYSPCKYCPCAEICPNVQKDTKSLSKAEKQEALKTVFGENEEKQEETADELD